MNKPSSNLEVGRNRDKVFTWITGTGCVLFLMPLVAMQFTSEVSWDETDFLVWAILLSVAGGACLWVSRKLPRREWLGAGALIAVVFVYIWAELAVGIFTNLGN